jgi:BTB And C-terminal Kelch
MLPFVVDQCTQYLWSDLSAKNACRAYEFARLFEEPTLQERCLQIMCTKTMDIINDSSFEEVELSTIITILDQDDLNVDNELSLFFALNRFAEKHGLRSDMDITGSDEEANAPIQVNVEAGPSNRPDPPIQQRVQELTIRDAVKKIRFLTLSPQQFAEGPARTNLLSQSEAFAILMNISTPNSVYPMPDGFTMNKNSRVPFDLRSPSPPKAPSLPSQGQGISVSVPQPAPALAQSSSIVISSPPLIHPYPAESPNFFHLVREQRISEERRYYYCIRTIQHIREVQNRSVLDCSFTFSVDRNVSILGLQMYTQIKPPSIAGKF